MYVRFLYRSVPNILGPEGTNEGTLLEVVNEEVDSGLE